MSTFKINDRVVIAGRGNGWDGITGTVTKVSDVFYLVSYDHPDELPGRCEGDSNGSWSGQYLRHLVRFAPGTPVRVSRETTARYVGTDSEFDLAAGQVLYVAEHVEGFGQYRLASDPVDVVEGDTGSTFWVNNADVEALPKQPSTPRASLQHETSREYAFDSRSSKLLTDDQNAILSAAGRGEEVDVFEFRKAATAALSAASTRAGQSPARREFAKMARHLIYWADAILENHINGLPVYEKGERSPKIKALEAEVAQAKKDLASANRQIEDLQATIDADRGQWESEVAEALAKANEEVKTITVTLQSREKHIDFLRTENDILIDVLAYIDSRIGQHESGRLHGYWAALRKVRREEQRS